MLKLQFDITSVLNANRFVLLVLNANRFVL